MLIRIVRTSRYLVLLPIIGLAIASAVLFAIGGIGLFGFVIESVLEVPWVIEQIEQELLSQGQLTTNQG